MNAAAHQLAQINIARMLAPLDDPLMAGFVAQLDSINAIADSSPGSVWRFQTLEGNATAIRPYADDHILVNFSVWASLGDLRAFVYHSHHRDVLRQRRQWFARIDNAYTALWWIPRGHVPSLDEAKERLDHLRAHGETWFAFSFTRPYPAPQGTAGGADEQGLGREAGEIGPILLAES
ncbi:MAG: DUF3291 domain-containing protein [Ktedonobacterales bacterium]